MTSSPRDEPSQLRSLVIEEESRPTSIANALSNDGNRIGLIRDSGSVGISGKCAPISDCHCCSPLRSPDGRQNFQLLSGDRMNVRTRMRTKRSTARSRKSSSTRSTQISVENILAELRMKDSAEEASRASSRLSSVQEDEWRDGADEKENPRTDGRWYCRSWRKKNASRSFLRDFHRGSSTSSRCVSSVVRWKSAQCRRLAWTIAFLMILGLPAFADAQRRTSISSSRKDGVCQSIDIRNNVSQFARLEGCRVVEGFVQILLIDRANESAYTNLTFPELVEITGYLILFRVNGLRSVGRLFPNLTVIRGRSLFINYAFVAFEMMDLQEIGLHSLTSIVRGSVRFEKNPSLCYVDTIDWNFIAKAGKDEHVISGNKPMNGCPICEKHCTKRLTKLDETLCWNKQYCQKICDRKCENGACDENGKCCHSSCLGGCNGPTAVDCKVCKDVVDGRQCRERCPNGTFEFMNLRCISEDECRRMKKPREAFSVAKEYPYKPFNGSCVIDCPAGYMDEDVKGKMSCKRCEGPCMKECAATSVDNIASAQKLRGCTHITGSLEIQIRGGKNIVNELEDSLNMIEEIDGYLKIVRSFPLISLNFLKRLRVIRGNALDSSKYTLIVLDNQNLQELWDWSTHPDIKIYSKDGPGKIFFHFNPKLCLHKIYTLTRKAGLPDFTDLEVASNSNGDKIACNVTELATRVTKTTSDAALIQWEEFKHHDPRSLLSYVVYFIEAPNRNVTMYDGRDACGGDGWRVDDVSTVDDTSEDKTSRNVSEMEQPNYLTHILTQLKPYTQYAFYVKTYTIATERSGAQSKVRYFTTKPHAPSAPRGLSTWSNSSQELIVSWFPPLRKNGNLTHYKIVGRWVRDDVNFTDQRNYCDEPLYLPDKKSISVMAEEERKRAEEEKELIKLSEPAACDCANRERDQSDREKEVSSSIAFEDALHNQVYIKRMNSRRRRDLSEMVVAARLGDSNGYEGKENNGDKIVNGTYEEFYREVPSMNLTYVMKDLRHFAYYNIEVQACRAPVKDDTNRNCSTKSVKTYRTLPYRDADNIPPNTFKINKSSDNNSLITVTLYWAEPPHPNGLIVAYHIEYKRLSIQDGQTIKVCITRKDFSEASNSYILKDLLPGNYSVKVRATSLAGNGDFTDIQYFYVEERSTRGPFWILFWSILCIMLFSIGGIVVFRRKLLRSVASVRLIATVNPEYVSTPYVPDEWEVPREKIKLIRKLGNGSFGMVWQGIASDIVKGCPEVQCAVKTVNVRANDRQRIEFLNEASVMKAFNTHHVVKLLGVVSHGQPTLVVMELMVNGDLKAYLRDHRPDIFRRASKRPPTFKNILRMAIEIADGMAYLAAKKFVHRDLAARNCMVAKDCTVKIGDFGMTRDIYETDYYRKNTKGLLPIRWMAPESLKDGVFTSYSDVWSYGIVLWEMVTLASQPYQGLSNDQVLRYVIDGGVMERPEDCPDFLYNLMRRIWNHTTTRRPTFIDIATILLPEINVETFEKVSFYHSPEGMEARNQNISYSPQINSDLKIATFQNLQEDDEIEGEEDSPLQPDFDDFANFQPTCMKHTSNSRYASKPYGENSKTPMNFHDMDSSKIPLKAVFDDFDDVSGNSLLSSKNILDLPYVEDSLKSVKDSPFTHNTKNVSPNNMNQALDPRFGSSHLAKRTFLDSPNTSKIGHTFNYESSNPELLIDTEEKEMIPLQLNFPSMDAIDVDISVEKNGKMSAAEYTNKSETLNNGYIGGTTT